MLLDQGGEIGFHGYNHMPLCLLGFDYGDGYESYRLWHSYEDMLASIQELKTFCEELFPKEKFQVYVPPSNILSEEGRTMLKEDVEGIKPLPVFILVIRKRMRMNRNLKWRRTDDRNAPYHIWIYYG